MSQFPPKRALQLLFGFFAASYVLLGVIVNPWLVSLFSADGNLATSTAQRLSCIQGAFLLLGLLSGLVCLCLAKIVPEKAFSPMTVRLLGPTAVFLFLLMVMEGLLAISLPPAYLPSHSTGQPLALLDDELGYRLNPEYGDGYSINSKGFRAPEFVSGDDSPRILCLGDSITFGLELNDAATTYPARLQELFDKAGSKVQVINAGIPGYASLNALRFLKKEVLALKPTVLVLCIGWNDLANGLSGVWKPNNLFTAVQRPIDRTPLAILRAVKWWNQKMSRPSGKSEHLQVAKAPGKATPSAKSIVDPRALVEYERNLKAIIETSRHADVQLLVLNMPTLISYLEMSEDERAKIGVFTAESVAIFQRSIERICREEEVLCVLDIFPLSQNKKNEYFWDYCHVSEAGARVIAKKVYAALDSFQLNEDHRQQ